MIRGVEGPPADDRNVTYPLCFISIFRYLSVLEVVARRLNSGVSEQVEGYRDHVEGY